MVNIRKRDKVYQYQFEIAKVDGKRKYISKSGFKTKDDKDSRIETTENYYISSTPETRKKVCNVLENIINSKIINEIIDYNKF